MTNDGPATAAVSPSPGPGMVMRSQRHSISHEQKQHADGGGGSGSGATSPAASLKRKDSIGSDAVSDRPESEASELQDFEDMIQDALEEKSALSKVNSELQRRIVLLWDKQDSTEYKMARRNTATNELQMMAEYKKICEQVNTLIETINERRDIWDEKVEKLNAKLDAQDEKATELCESFKAFKREIARAAEFSRTGKPLKFKRILAFEAAEDEKDKEVESVRLKNIHYLNLLEKLEQEVRQKEELAEGLHLIDFEQLKIENQTLNEKIEERNDELHKLKKKTTNTVQVLTHIKEKLKFVKDENTVLSEQLKHLEAQTTELRDRLSKAKQQREQLRSENVKMKHKQGFVGSDLLVEDFEKRKHVTREMEEKVAALKARHAHLTEATAKLQSQS